MTNPTPTPPIYVPPTPPDLENPFAGDLFNRRKVADQLTGFLTRLPQGGVFAIDAPWGEGKSWFGKNWHADLLSKDFKSVYIDAFASDYVDDPFVMITAELLAVIKKDKGVTTDTVIEKAKKVGRVLAPAAAKYAINGLGRAILGSANLSEEMKTIAEKASESAADAVEKQIEERLEAYERDKESVKGFKDALTEVAESSEKPIVIFIDELDRCRPDFAVKTIERIKHFFDVPRLVFVLLLNRIQLCESIKGVYGSGLDADTYLGKFIQFSVKLQKKQSLRYLELDDNCKFCLSILDKYFGENIEHRTKEYFSNYLGSFANLTNMSLRDIELGIAMLSIAWSTPKDIHPNVIVWPIVLKLKFTTLYQRILLNEKKAHEDAIKKLDELDAMSDSSVFYKNNTKTWKELHAFNAKMPNQKLSDTSQNIVDRFSSINENDALPNLFNLININIKM